MQRLAWLTDPHLNFLSARRLERFVERLRDTEADALLVGGDIGEAPSLVDFLCHLARAGKPVYFVLGNHDYYQGSIHQVRAAVQQLCRDEPLLHWLPDAGPVPLSDDAALIGHGGWGDGRLGDYQGSTVMLNDYLHIAELAGLDKEARLEQLMALGDDAAARLAPTLQDALDRAKHLLVLTHVPPFCEACWHEGHLSAPDWLPHFTCGALGELLAGTMKSHPEHRMMVLSGHTHGGGRATILPNLTVRTGAAEYGLPAVEAIADFP